MYKKNILLAAGGFVLLVIIALRLALMPGLGALKHRIEAGGSQALENPVVIKGRLSISFVTGLELSFRDITIGEAGREILKAEKVRVWPEFGPLLRREFRLSRLDIIGPVLSVDRVIPLAREFNRFSGSFPERTLTLKKLNLTRGRLTYTGAKPWENADAGGLSAVITDISYSGKSDEAPLKKIALAGKLSCGRLRIGGLAFTGVTMEIKAGKNGFDVSRIRAAVLGGEGEGGLKADLAAVPPRFALNWNLDGFRVEELLQAFSPRAGFQRTLEGPADLRADLTAGGAGAGELKRSLGGTLSLTGRDLVLNNMDVDAVVARFERSQNFNLLDAGAFLLAGPLGTALTKSYNFTALAALGTGKRGTVSRFSSSWKIKNGVAEAEDVALASKKQRLAAKGSISLAGGRFDGLTVAVLDKRGCAAYSQKLYGDFSSPRMGKVSMLESLTGPVTSVLGKTVKLIPGLGCKTFYSGSVPKPAD